MRSIFRGLAAWLGLVAGCAALAATAQDLPTRVGRVAYVEGSVSIYQDPEFGWAQAYVNSPVTSQNSLWTDADSRAEMRVGGLALRVDDLTQLDVSHLDDDGIDATVQRGALAIRLRHFERGANYLFSTPQAQFRLLGDGRYRLDADPDGQSSRLEVFNGFAVLQSSDGDVRVNAGSAIVVGPDGYHFERVDRDGFDRWADARDRAWVERTVVRYLPPDITGYEELDAYGTWITEPGYGALWMPTHVGANWVPYREGRWAWVSPWGWTWIDNEPWGYAPFHYGRWVQVRDRWCWYPGRRVDRQAWAPALVGWIGGSGFSVTVSSGASTPALGWYPLAPEERFHPWYRASNTYVNRVNVIVNNVTVNNVTINRGGPPPREVNRLQAATVVPRETLLQQRPVAQNVVHVAPQVVRQAPAAQPANVLPSRNDFARERPPQRAPGSRERGPQDQRAAGPAAGGSLAGTPAQGARPPEHPFARPVQRPAPQAAPSAAGAPKPGANAPGGNPFARTPDRGNRGEREGARAAPTPQQQPQAAPAAPAANPFARTPERANRGEREAPRTAPAPHPQPQPQAAPAAPPANPFARSPEHDNRGSRDARGNPPAQPQTAPGAPVAPQAADRQREQQQQERAAREAQQRAAEQQRQQQQQQQQQERAAREAQQHAAEQQRQQQQQQQQQERAAREAQQRAAEQQRQQQQQQQQQERAAREAQQRAAEQQRQQQQQQQQQERAAREAQQRAAEQQRQQQQQQQQQERAAREAQQRAAEQQRQQQQQQQAQQRAAEQQQRALQQQQERAAREAQRPPQAQHPSPPPEKNEKKDDHGSGG